MILNLQQSIQTLTTEEQCKAYYTPSTEPVAPATVGKFALMTGCASAKDDVTCNQASNRCSWNSTTKACAEHTCDTYKTQVGSCRYFYTWDMKKYNICSTVSGKCVATDAATLPEGDCYTLTAYQYSWNPTSSKCAQCGTVIAEPNNSNNTNSTTNGTTTDSGYILAWTSAVLAYLIM